MIQLYSFKKNIYSVDMMIAYVRNKKPQEIHVRVEDFVPELNQNIWGNPSKGIRYSPMSVILTPTSNPNEYDRIKKANLDFPIIISENGNIIDGAHRACKAYLDKIEYIRAYMFGPDLIEKFLIDKEGNWGRANKIPIHDFIVTYTNRFGGLKEPKELQELHST